MKQLFYINNYPINSGSHCFITMACSYNSDWNDFVKIECEKLRKKGHVFDAEGTHMKLIGEKYQKKLAREEKKKSQPGGAKSKKQQNNEDVASCINTMNNASHCCTLSGYIDAVSRCEGIYQEWLVTNPSKAKLLQDELIRHQRLVSTRIAKSKYNDKCKDKKRQDREEAKAKQQEELAKVQKEAEAKAKQHEERKAAKAKAKCEELSKVAYDAYIRQKQQEELERVQKEAEAKAKQQKEQLEYEANRRDEMLRIRAKQQEELERVQKEAETKRIQDIAVAKALQELLETREREAKTKEEERIREDTERAKKHQEKLEDADARAIEAEKLVKAMEREQIAKSNARAKQLNELIEANARAKELEKIVKSNREAEIEQIKAQLEKERNEFEQFKILTMERENLAKAKSVSKFALALQGEIERRKHDKSPVKFRLMRNHNTESKLAVALKEVINRRRKIKLGLL